MISRGGVCGKCEIRSLYSTSTLTGQEWQSKRSSFSTRGAEDGNSRVAGTWRRVLDVFVKVANFRCENLLTDGRNCYTALDTSKYLMAVISLETSQHSSIVAIWTTESNH